VCVPVALPVARAARVTDRIARILGSGRMTVTWRTRRRVGGEGKGSLRPGYAGRKSLYSSSRGYFEREMWGPGGDRRVRLGRKPATIGLKGCRPYGPMYRVAPASEKSPNEGLSASGLLVASRRVQIRRFCLTGRHGFKPMPTSCRGYRGGSNAHLTSFVLYEFACLHNPEFLICATAELWYVLLGQSGRQRRGTRRR
jgi:hypothetical protein